MNFSVICGSSIELQRRGDQRSSIHRGGSAPVFLLEPPTKYYFSNSTGGILNCAGTTGGVGGHVSTVEVSWTTSDQRPVHSVSTVQENINI